MTSQESWREESIGDFSAREPLDALQTVLSYRVHLLRRDFGCLVLVLAWMEARISHRGENIT